MRFMEYSNGHERNLSLSSDFDSSDEVKDDINQTDPQLADEQSETTKPETLNAPKEDQSNDLMAVHSWNTEDSDAIGKADSFVDKQAEIKSGDD